MSVETRTQGGRAGDAGRSAREAVAASLLHLGRLQEVSAKNIEGLIQVPVGGLMADASGDFATDVRVCDCGVLHRAVSADYVIRRKCWSYPLALFVCAQNTGGSTDEKILSKIWNAQVYACCPTMLVLLGEHWESPCAPHTAWVAQQAGRKPGRLLRVIVGLAEFRSWIHDCMPWPDSQLCI